LKVPAQVAAVATWLGLGAILVAAFFFTAQTPYPGSLVTLPVVGAALIIAGGVCAPRFGVEALLHLAPFRGLGRISYSLYLWHWPILILAAEHGGSASPSFPGSLGWVLLALALSVVTYVLVENPIRHAKALFRIRWASIGLGAALVATTFGAVVFESSTEIASGIGVARAMVPASAASAAGPVASLQEVLRLVAASVHIQSVPNALVPPLPQAALQPLSNLGEPPARCFSALSQSALRGCTFGDRSGSFTMVLYGDSHAGMWFPDINKIATQAHWRLVVLLGHNCALSWYPMSVSGLFYGIGAYCNQLHQFAVQAINRIDPDLLIVAQSIDIFLNPVQWQRGLAQQLRRITAPKTRKIVIGNEPFAGGGDLYAGGPMCLGIHTDDVQACSIPRINWLTPWVNAERQAAEAANARYLDVTPWFCAQSCSSIIGKYDVYFNIDHVAIGYQRFLEGVLADAIDLPKYAVTLPGS